MCSWSVFPKATLKESLWNRLPSTQNAEVTMQKRNTFSAHHERSDLIPSRASEVLQSLLPTFCQPFETCEKSHKLRKSIWLFPQTPSPREGRWGVALGHGGEHGHPPREMGSPRLFELSAQNKPWLIPSMSYTGTVFSWALETPPCHPGQLKVHVLSYQKSSLVCCEPLKKD